MIWYVTGDGTVVTPAGSPEKRSVCVPVNVCGSYGLIHAERRLEVVPTTTFTVPGEMLIPGTISSMSALPAAVGAFSTVNG
jgi:hypothetical protein